MTVSCQTWSIAYTRPRRRYRVNSIKAIAYRRPQEEVAWIAGVRAIDDGANDRHVHCSCSMYWPAEDDKENFHQVTATAISMFCGQQERECIKVDRSIFHQTGCKIRCSVAELMLAAPCLPQSLKFNRTFRYNFEKTIPVPRVEQGIVQSAWEVVAASCDQKLPWFVKFAILLYM